LPELDIEGVPGTSSSALRPVLVVLTGAQIGERLLLESAPVEVGRDPRAALVLRDSGVAFRHARFEPIPDGWIVSALEPTNGIEVNGTRVAQTTLSPDDRIQIGSIVVRFELHGPAEQAFDAAVEERLSRDDLTGLLSRRKFELQLSGSLDAAAQSGESLGLAVLDLDGLKQINDRHGHLIGARMIATAGRAIAARLAASAFACRLGGDEFAVAWPGASIERMARLAEQLIDAVAAACITHDGEVLRVAASAGVAVGPTQGTEIFSLVRAADDALFRAKRDGGACVRR
jgi:diguanylate cyclase (GGDEF)-like protein